MPFDTTQVTTESTTISTTLPATFPATQPHAATSPTTQPRFTEDVKSQGDLVMQVTHAIEHVGLADTVLHTPLTSWMLFAFGLFSGLAVGRIVGMVIGRAGQRAAEKVKLIRAVLINSFAGPISLMLFMCGLVFGLTFLTLSDPVQRFLVAFVQLMNLIWIGWLLYNLIDLVTIVLGRWSRGRQGSLSIMLVPLARKTLRVVLVTVLLLFAAENIFKQDVKTLLAGLGIVGLAVSLAAQDTVRNLFGSIMIFADQPFSLGDHVKVSDYDGQVEDIGFRSTRLRTADGYVATIPNGNIASAAVLNFSRRLGIRRGMDVTLPTDASPDQMSKAITLLREALADPEIAAGLDPNHPPTVLFDDPTQRRARVEYWFKRNDAKAYAAHAEKLNLEIMERFHQAGIAFK